MSFAVPLCLLALAGMGVPFWFHRRRVVDLRAESVASLFLLESDEAPVLRSRRFEHLLLLVLRCALIALAALAFAQPLWFSSAEPPSSGERRADSAHIVVVDVSLSMRYGDRLPRARTRALEYVRGLPESAPVRVLAAGGRVQTLTRWQDPREAHLQALSTLEAGLGRTTDVQLQRVLSESISDLRAESGLPEQVRVFWVSDFQQNALEQTPSELEVDALVIPHSVAAEAAGNASIEELGVQMPAGEAPTLRVSVRSRAESASERVMVVEQEGTEVERRTLRLPSSGRVSVSFPLRGAVGQESNPAGEQRILVRLEPADLLPADDVRRLVVPRRGNMRIGVISDENAERGRRYLRAVLVAAYADGVDLRELAPDQLADQALDPTRDVLILLDTPLPAGARARLRRFLEAGGGLFGFVGARLSAAKADARDTLNAVGLREARVESAEGGYDVELGSTSLEAADASLPLESLLLDSGWRDVRILRRVRFGERVRGTVWLRTTGGVPLVFDHALGSGRALVFGAGVDLSFSDLPVRPVFLTLVRAALAWVRPHGEEVRDVEVEHPLVVAGGGDQVLNPEGTPLLSLLETQTGARVRLEVPGFYTLVNGSRSRSISVNPDPLESDLTSLSLSPEALVQEAPANSRSRPSYSHPSEGSAASRAERTPSVVELGFALLLAAAGVLVVQSIYANLAAAGLFRGVTASRERA